MFFCLAWMVSAASAPHAMIITSEANPDTDATLQSAFAPNAEVMRIALVDRAELKEEADAEQAAIAAQKAGQKLAVFLKDDAAIAKFEEALRLFGRALPQMANARPIAECFIDLGAAWLDKRKEEKAIGFFRRAAAISLSAKADDLRHNPAVAALYAKVQDEVLRASRLPLTIVTDPPGAEIRLDGNVVGVSPLSVDGVVPGEHWLVARRPGYRFFSSPYDIERGTNAKIELFLRAFSDSAMLDLLGRAEQPTDAARLEQLGADVVVIVAEDGKRGRVWLRDKRALSPVLSVAQASELPAALQRFVVSQRAPGEVPAAASAPILAPAHELNPFMSALPLGVSEFKEHRPLAGGLFLGSEIALLAVNVVTAVVVYTDRLPNGNYQNGARDRVLQVVNLTAFGLLIADLVGNGADGFFHRGDVQ